MGQGNRKHPLRRGESESEKEMRPWSRGESESEKEMRPWKQSSKRCNHYPERGCEPRNGVSWKGQEKEFSLRVSKRNAALLAP